MITTNLTLTNGATSEVPITVTGVTFQAETKLSVNASVIFPLTVAIDSSEIIGIDFDETLYSGDFIETMTINTLGGNNDLVHTVNINDSSVLTPPSEILDFNATDLGVGSITMTWTNATGNPLPTYALFEDNIAVVGAENITSGYVHTVAAGTYTYRVDAINSEGTQPSNNEDGTSIEAGGTTSINLNGRLVTDPASGRRDLVNSDGSNIVAVTNQGVVISDVYSIPTVIDLVAGSYIYYVYDGLLTEKLVASDVTDFVLNPANLSGSGVYSNFIFTPTELSQGNQDSLLDSPETFLYRVGTVLTSDVLSQPEIDGLTAWLPAIESGNTMYQMVESTGGDEDILTAIGDTVTDGGGCVSVYSTNEIDSFDLAVTTVGTDAYSPYQGIDMQETKSTETYKLTFDAVVNSGTPILYSIDDDAGGSLTLAHTIIDGYNEVDIYSPSAGQEVNNVYLHYNGENLFDISVTNFRYVEVGIDVPETDFTITNYDVACRDDAKGGSTGLQTIAWMVDSDGKPTGLSDIPADDVYLYVRHLGIRPTLATPLEEGTMFAAPDAVGGGDGTEGSPYTLDEAFAAIPYTVNETIVLFLRGGTYNIPTGGLWLESRIGTSEFTTTIESYPGEVAILDGQNRTPQDIIDELHNTNLGWWIDKCEYLFVRKLEVIGMSSQGIYMSGRYNKLQGLDVHHNFLTGVQITDRSFSTPTPTDGWHIVEDCEIRDNSDAGIASGGWGEHNDGNNADGLSISSGTGSIARYNYVHDNSDDGIDSWHSIGTIFEYNIVSGHGIAAGDGHGVKMGGALAEYTDIYTYIGKECIARYNLVYNNSKSGFHQNAGYDITLYFNTAFNNGTYNYEIGDNPPVYPVLRFEDNIGQDGGDGESNYSPAIAVHNSWQIGDGVVDFYSEVEGENGFLVPTEEENHFIGVYEGFSTTPPTEMNPLLPTSVPIFITGDSTVCFYTSGEDLRGWGMSLEEALLLNPSRTYNHARSGASVKSFQDTNDQTDPNNLGLFWGDGVTPNASGNKGVLQNMIEMDTTLGGYVLVCFGHNDCYMSGDTYNDNKAVPNEGNEFDIEIMKYIADARANNVTPILVTCSSQMSVYGNNEYYRLQESSLDDSTPAPYEALRGQLGDWTQTIRDIGARENILVLDLMTKAFTHYFTFSTNQDIQTAYSGDGGDVHTNQAGADMLADYVKEASEDISLSGFSAQFI